MTKDKKDKLKWFAKLGYAARGTIYLAVGVLALMTVTGGGGKTTGSKDAIATLLEQPFGVFIVGVVAVGLFGYSAWRFTQAIKDTDNHGHELKGSAIRGGLFVSSLTHLALGIWTVSLLSGDGGSGGSSSSWLDSTLGQIFLFFAGVATIGAGIAHVIKGWTARFEKYMNLPASHKDVSRHICRFGLISRGVVWLIVGSFLIDTSLRAGGGEMKGLEDALNALLQAAHGPWLMAVVAAGLVAFGTYSLFEARYRKINLH